MSASNASSSGSDVGIFEALFLTVLIVGITFGVMPRILSELHQTAATTISDIHVEVEQFVEKGEPLLSFVADNDDTGEATLLHAPISGPVSKISTKVNQKPRANQIVLTITDGSATVPILVREQ